jgi:hypothetical protein
MVRQTRHSIRQLGTWGGWMVEEELDHLEFNCIEAATLNRMICPVLAR